MALVSYDSSDNSDINDDDESSTNLRVKSNENNSRPLADPPRVLSIVDVENGLQKENLFNTLPRPSHNKIIEEDDEFLHKKDIAKKEKTKIAIPSLSEFKDLNDDDLVKKKSYQGSVKKSGLLNLLPEPKFSGSSNKKTSKPLIPNVVERKIVTVNPNPPVKKPDTSKALQPTSSKANLFLTADYSDSDEDEHENLYSGKDFFSIQSRPVVLAEESTDELTEDKSYKIAVNKKPVTENAAYNNLVQTEQPYSHTVENITEELAESTQHHFAETVATTASSSNDLQLDEEALRQLCGSRKRHRKEDIQVITVDQQQVLSDSREWLVKGLMDDTSKRVSASKKRGNEPTSQQKRKHQITYLAHQAKANEAELQNQWSNNRMTKRQTQSKYGF